MTEPSRPPDRRSATGTVPAPATLWLVLAILVVAGGSPAAADADGEARDLYARICSKCHGLIREDRLSQRPGYLVTPAVTMPLGPTLDGIYLRPAGTIAGYRYSRAFRELATGWAWDDEALDLWLADSQAFVRGSTMYLKVGQPERARIIGYLKKYARYRR